MIVVGWNKKEGRKDKSYIELSSVRLGCRMEHEGRKEGMHILDRVIIRVHTYMQVFQRMSQPLKWYNQYP